MLLRRTLYSVNLEEETDLTEASDAVPSNSAF